MLQMRCHDPKKLTAIPDAGLDLCVLKEKQLNGKSRIMSEDTKKGEARATFSGAVMPARAEDCGMEEAGAWGLLKEPQHQAAHAQTRDQTPARPSFFGD